MSVDALIQLLSQGPSPFPSPILHYDFVLLIFFSSDAMSRSAAMYILIIMIDNLQGYGKTTSNLDWRGCQGMSRPMHWSAVDLSRSALPSPGRL